MVAKEWPKHVGAIVNKLKEKTNNSGAFVGYSFRIILFLRIKLYTGVTPCTVLFISDVPKMR
jgi:hypothetical protein